MSQSQLNKLNSQVHIKKKKIFASTSEFFNFLISKNIKMFWLLLIDIDFSFERLAPGMKSFLNNPVRR